MRISIIGQACSGKTTLAKEISQKFGIPHIQIDRFWFEAGGIDVVKKTPLEKKERVQKHVRENVLKAIAPTSWVSDGFYSREQMEIANKADVVIYLNTPLWRRLMNHATRLLKPSERHKELNAWNEFTFFFEIVRRHFVFRPKFKKFFSEYKDKLVTLRSRKETKDYLENLNSY